MSKNKEPRRTRLRNPPRKRNGSSSPALTPDYASLEARCMLATTITWDTATLSVTFQGDALDNWSTVDPAANNRVQFAADFAATLELDLAQVVRVYFYGGDGHDSFSNGTAIPGDIRGQGGNDSLFGGSGDDLFYGGDNDDYVNGGAGNDTIYGTGGNDQLYGDAGNDYLSGDYGNDSLSGGDGNDTLAGGWGDDYMWGDAGSDSMLGFTGNDWMYGGDGMDFVYGQAGDDHVYGGAEFDRVRGNNGNDFIYGEGGNDWMMGDVGDDLMDGGDGNDTLWGWTGNDTLIAGAGDDGLFGQQDDDIMYGGAGSDVLSGEGGNDQLFGGLGNDFLYGYAGNDILHGEGGNDVLRGGDGMDSLFGGDELFTDTLFGEAGADRFLTQTGDFISDLESIDAELQFINNTSDWNDAEIAAMDLGLGYLHMATGNTRLLKDTLTTTPLKFIKYQSLNGAAGVNWLETTTNSVWQNGQWVTYYTYKREIRIAEWAETDEFRNTQQPGVVTHELGHNWDSTLELSTASSSLSTTWSDFKSVSDWRDVDPQNAQYSLSGNGQWWYLTNSPFYDSYGQTDPYEDFSTTWELYFDPNASASDMTLMSQKLAVLDQLMSVVSQM